MNARVSFFAFCVLTICVFGCKDGSSGNEPGDGCNASNPSSCGDLLVCEAVDGDGVCLIPAGGECDLDAEDANCATDSSCVGITEVAEDGSEVVVGQCRISEGGACDPAEELCDPALRCEELVDTTYACFRPVEIRGDVIDAATSGAIEGAHVIALDVIPVAVTDIAVSDVNGNYVLGLPTVRELDGTPVLETHTLRASADGYQTFPGGIRTALPFSTSAAVQMDDAWVIEDTFTQIALIELEDLATPRTTISGAVIAEENAAGVLVVAEGPITRTAISDLGGNYTVFNVFDGDYEVRGYAADLQLTPVSVSVAGVAAENVNLVETDTPALGTLDGTINIVNAFGGAATSVVLVVESTFDENLARGEVPPGLRAPREGEPNVTGAFTITGVPAGRYVVLAAFENDDLVRDPDELIAGTGFVRVDVPGADGPMVTLDQSFKVTEALEVFGPGSDVPEAVRSAPTLEWADDSSEEFYEVIVRDAFGNLAWMETVDGVSGSDTVSVTYGGPLEPGMYYQFRATSFRMPGGGMASPISATEDLRGVFFVE